MATRESLAYGELGLLPWQWLRLTPWEFTCRAEGLERTWERLAALVRWVVQKDYAVDLTTERLLHGRPGVPRK